MREYGPFAGADNMHGVTHDGQRVWAATGAKLLAFDPESGQVERTLARAGDAGTAFDGKHLYQIAEARIDKIDPATGDVVASIPAPGHGSDSGLAWAEGSLWVGQYRDRKIHQIDPETGAVLRTIESNRFVTGVTWVDGELWHGTWEGDESEIRRIDPESGAVLERLEMPRGIGVSGLESDGADLFYCGGGASGKVRAVRRPKARNRHKEQTMNTATEQARCNHPVVSADRWLAERKTLLAREKELTHLRDQIARERRALPWVRVEKDYVFDTPEGRRTLADLFEGRRQLLVQHFMFGPGWEQGCPSCSFMADHTDGMNVHLAHRDITFVAISRAPLAEIERFRSAWAGSSAGCPRSAATSTTTSASLHAGRRGQGQGPLQLRHAGRSRARSRRASACSTRTTPARSSTPTRPTGAASR